MRRLYSREINEWLELPDEPSRIVSLTPSVTEVIVELGLGERLVGVSSWCKALAIVRGYEGLMKLPVAGTYSDVVDEVVRAADLIIFSGGYQRSLVKSLKALGLKYYVADLPKSVWGVGDMILQVSAALNALEGGIKLSREFLRGLSRVAGTLKGLERIKAYVELNLGELAVPGYFSHIINGLELIGLETVNRSLLKPYAVGEEATELAKSFSKEANLIIYEDKSIRPDIKRLRKEAAGRYGREIDEVIILPALTLTDYGPHLPKNLLKVKELIKLRKLKH